MSLRWPVLSLCIFSSSLAFLNAQEPAAPTPDQAWQRLKEGNDRFTSDRMEKKEIGAKKRAELYKGQHPHAIVLACADSRVPPEVPP